MKSRGHFMKLAIRRIIVEEKVTTIIIILIKIIIILFNKLTYIQF